MTVALIKIGLPRKIGKILVAPPRGRLKFFTMKKLLFVAMMCGLPLLFIACRKSNVTPTQEKTTLNSENPAPTLSEILIAGSWAVDFYYDEEDKSTDFTGFVFTFKSDGSLVFKKENESYTGAWKLLNEDGVTKLFININTINIIQKL